MALIDTLKTLLFIILVGTLFGLLIGIVIFLCAPHEITFMIAWVGGISLFYLMVVVLIVMQFAISCLRDVVRTIIKYTK
jgi:hypothetical protein